MAAIIQCVNLYTEYLLSQVFGSVIPLVRICMKYTILKMKLSQELPTWQNRKSLNSPPPTAYPNSNYL